MVRSQEDTVSPLSYLGGAVLRYSSYVDSSEGLSGTEHQIIIVTVKLVTVLSLPCFNLPLFHMMLFLKNSLLILLLIVVSIQRNGLHCDLFKHIYHCNLF